MATLYELILEFKIKVRTTLHSTPLLCPKTYYQVILYKTYKVLYEGEKGFLFGLICYYHTRGPTVMYPDIEQ